ncbi:fructose PTS transporter subunit IIA [Streptococcus suis]|nr:fructose PTS transporter subunit IIA [Streptococcus suis]
MEDVNTAIHIVDMISPNIITLDLQSTSKLGVIEELSNLLVRNGDITDKDIFVKDVLLRETEGITGIGQGLAIPHGKSTTVVNTTIAIGIAHHDIAWESLDNQPVKVVFLFAVRDQDASTVHLKLLQRVAVLLADETFVEKLQRVESKEALLSMLS